MDLSHAIIQNLICPPPPKRIERISRQELRELVVPKPDIVLENNRINNQSNDVKSCDPSTSALERLFRNVDELSRYCRPTSIVSGDEPEFMMKITQTPRVKPLSDTQRIRKVIFELIETERSYVQVSKSKFTFQGPNIQGFVLENNLEKSLNQLMFIS